MLNSLQSRIVVGTDWYNTYRKKIQLLTDISIKNKVLAKELAYECIRKEGALTYAEFLTIEQFGKNGFYSLHNHHGQTDIHTRWGSALAKYCVDNGHKYIIEFGSGTGELGVAICKAYKQITDEKLTWIGIEIDTHIHKKIFEKFKNSSLNSYFGAVVTTIDEIPDIQNALLVFPYSLDSIPPQVFLNTRNHSLYPDALLGIIIKNGLLSETVIPQELLHKKRIKLEQGLFTHNDISYKLTGWKLRKGQRLFLSTDAFGTMYLYAKKFKNSSMLIIDEFRNEPWVFDLGNLGTPKSLYEKNLQCNELKRYYRESGTHNVYFPLYKTSVYKFLNTIGFRSVSYDIEQKTAANIIGKRWHSLRKKYTTYAFIAKHYTEKDMHILSIPSAQKRIV